MLYFVKMGAKYERKFKNESENSNLTTHILETFTSLMQTLQEIWSFGKQVYYVAIKNIKNRKHSCLTIPKGPGYSNLEMQDPVDLIDSSSRHLRIIQQDLNVLRNMKQYITQPEEGEHLKDPLKQEFESRISNKVKNLEKLVDFCMEIGQYLEACIYLFSEIANVGIRNHSFNESVDSPSVNTDSQVFDGDEFKACSLINKGYIRLTNRMIQFLQYSRLIEFTSDFIQQSFMSQLSLGMFISRRYECDEEDVNRAVVGILAFRARRKTALQSRYWLITEEVFTNAIRLTISVRDLYYTVIYPTDSRMNIYIPSFVGGYFYQKERSVNKYPLNTNMRSPYSENLTIAKC